MSDGTTPKEDSSPSHHPASGRALKASLRVVAVAILTALMTAAIGLAGLAHVPWWGFAGMVVLLVCVLIAAEEALRANHHKDEIHWLRVALVVALLIPIALWAYHQWLDPQDRSPRAYDMVVNLEDAYMLRQSAFPGDPPTLCLGSFAGGWIIQVHCFAMAPDGTPGRRTGKHRLLLDLSRRVHPVTHWAAPRQSHAVGGIAGNRNSRVDEDELEPNAPRRPASGYSRSISPHQHRPMARANQSGQTLDGQDFPQRSLTSRMRGQVTNHTVLQHHSFRHRCHRHKSPSCLRMCPR